MRGRNPAHRCCAAVVRPWHDRALAHAASPAIVGRESAPAVLARAHQFRHRSMPRTASSRKAHFQHAAGGVGIKSARQQVEAHVVVQRAGGAPCAGAHFIGSRISMPRPQVDFCVGAAEQPLERLITRGCAAGLLAHLHTAAAARRARLLAARWRATPACCWCAERGDPPAARWSSVAHCRRRPPRTAVAQVCARHHTSMPVTTCVRCAPSRSTVMRLLRITSRGRPAVVSSNWASCGEGIAASAGAAQRAARRQHASARRR